MTTAQKLSCRDWIVMITLPFTLMMSSYSNFSLGGLLPLYRQNFNLTDVDAAWLKTSNSIAHGTGFATMWLLGDCLPKKTAFLISLLLWIIFNFATTLVTSNQYLLFLILRSIESMIGEIFRIFIAVMQADHFTGKYLTAALTANIVGEAVAVLASSTVNSIFVANGSGWRIAMIISPTLAIPFLILNACFLRSQTRQSFPHPTSVLRNALGVFLIPSYVLMVFSQCMYMFYSYNLAFWMPSMMLYAFESLPDVFLGLSYPVITTVMSIAGVVGMFVAAFLVPYANHSLEAGSSVLGCIPPTALAIPMVYIVCSLLETMCLIAQIRAISTSFVLFVVAFFLDGLVGCGITLNNQQITLNTIPSNQRASAFALHRLMLALFNLPSAQIIAAISDFFRGASTDPADRVGALQKTFLYTWFMPVISTIMCLVILRFYKNDVQRAKQRDREVAEETKPLINEKQQFYD